MKDSINYRIRKLRESRDLSQENVAFELGLSKSAYNKIETGKTSPTANRLLEIAKVLEVDISDFFSGSKVTNKVEDPKVNYGYATKNEVDELKMMVEAITREVKQLKALVQEERTKKPTKQK